MSKIGKTNAVRLLDAEKVRYSLRSYEVDESDLSAVHVAGELGEPVDRLFKTLVLKGDKTGHFVCVVPGGQELDLKKAAKISGNKKCEMIPMKDLPEVAGYIRGACSPIGMKRQYPTYIHESCNNYDCIYVSAGRRGLQIEIDPRELIKIARMTEGDLVCREDSLG